MFPPKLFSFFLWCAPKHPSLKCFLTWNILFSYIYLEKFHPFDKMLPKCHHFHKGSLDYRYRSNSCTFVSQSPVVCSIHVIFTINRLVLFVCLYEFYYYIFTNFITRGSKKQYNISFTVLYLLIFLILSISPCCSTQRPWASIGVQLFYPGVEWEKELLNN